MSFYPDKSPQPASIKTAFHLLSYFFGIVIEDGLDKVTALDAHWSAACSESALIALPRSAHDVAVTLKIVHSLRIPFSIRSGCHSPNPGWSSTGQQGLMIDLRTLNQVTVSEDRQIVSVEPRALWGDVYNRLDSHRISVIGGRIPAVGVGSLILGDGTIANANADEKPDHFWALKGEVQISVRHGQHLLDLLNNCCRHRDPFRPVQHPVHNIWHQVGIYQIEKAPAFFEAFAEWQGDYSDVRATVALVVRLDIVTLGLIYSEPSSELPACFAPFNDIPAITNAVPPTNGTVLALPKILGAAAAHCSPR
ncbi:uncharacterized protein BDW43DRAFT_310287 [Aspergillus alliaceus]|uniref:uncharacterized protein n=1 Tax=Petromyces alliaceus TaxID=209559 RepID=UPI0012A7340B|nr:uncharacterized protein BDW43DRAFT_310287 [Aspergillus alliaceus]KAB8234260.1 hypothetical protein BDW43DRAFT_310287 [Aspergillus alliaceus]